MRKCVLTPGQDWQGKIVGGHLRERGSLEVSPDGDGVETHIDPARRPHDVIEMLRNRLSVEGIDLGRFGHAATRGDFLCHRLQFGQRAAGEEDPGSVFSERTGDRAADHSGGSVNHGDLVIEQHGV